MEKISKFALFIFTALLALHSPLATAKNSNLFTEYIGALFNGVKFSDVPINSGVQFHFILSFAIDYTTSTNPPSPTNGKFGIYWDNTNLSPSAISAFKMRHPNVKLAVSLGGSTVNNYLVNFTITSVNSWVNNAVSSLTTLIEQYHLDGVDIDYENFPAKVSPDTFAQCIGQLLTKLKKNRVISFASIAPFADPDVQRHYQALWKKYSEVIDYVNFQFYGYPSSTTESQFLSYYKTQTSNYKGGKVLASFISGDNSGGLSPANGFFNATKKLQSEGSLPGIFVWSADSSHASKVDFQYEIQAQKLLAKAY